MTFMTATKMMILTINILIIIKNKIAIKNKQKRHGRVCRSRQISEKERLNRSKEEKKGINTENIRSKKGCQTD